MNLEEMERSWEEEFWQKGESPLLEIIKTSEVLTNIYSNGWAVPKYNALGVVRKESMWLLKTISVERLFTLLGIPVERLKEVYEFSDEENCFTGRFTENGKQQLANILGKTIEFYHLKDQPDSSIDENSREVFIPQPTI